MVARAWEFADADGPAFTAPDGTLHYMLDAWDGARLHEATLRAECDALARCGKRVRIHHEVHQPGAIELRCVPIRSGMRGRPAAGESAEPGVTDGTTGA